MQDRNTRAFELVYERHAAAALGLARRILGERGLAEDVTQEAFVAVWRSAANYRPELGSVRTWVLGITRNRAIDGLRRRSSQERIRVAAEAFTDRSAEREPTNAQAVRNAEARAVRGAIGGLPDEQRRAIELSFFAGLTQTEIAGELDLPLGTVKGRMRLALDKLRRVLGPNEGVA
jgi:RNA polymerase sigma-70 factor (ECF subfamily)